jgi:hypothetical protein
MIAAMIKISDIPSEQFGFFCSAIINLIKLLGKMFKLV